MAPASTPNLHHLPLELLAEAAQYLDNRDRSALRLVSTACARLGIHILLQDVHVKISAKSIVHFIVLAQFPAFARHVRSLTLIAPRRSWVRGYGRLPQYSVEEVMTARSVARRYSPDPNDVPVLDVPARAVAEDESHSLRLMDLLLYTTRTQAKLYDKGHLDQHFMTELLAWARWKLRNLERICVDSDASLFAWIFPTDLQPAHVGHVELKSAKEHGQETDDNAGLLQCFVPALSQNLASLQIRSEPGVAFELQDTFEARVWDVAACFVKTVNALDMQMLTVAPGPQPAWSDHSAGQAESGWLRNHPSLLLAICVSHVLSHATRLAELDLHFAYDLASLRDDPDEDYIDSTLFLPFDLLFSRLHFPRLRRLNIGSLAAREETFASFLARHSGTLRDLSIANVKITKGSWVAWFRHVRETLALQRARVSGSLFGLEEGLLLHVDEDLADDMHARLRDGYFGTPRMVTSREVKGLGERLGAICTVHVPLDGEVWTSTIALLKRCFMLD